MDDFEFLNYLQTPDEKYFMGIATTRIYGKIVLKYKIVQKKDNSGYFIAPPNYRLPVKEDGTHKYIDAFLIDSRTEHDLLLEFIRKHVNMIIHPRQNQQEQQQQQNNPPVQHSQVNHQQAQKQTQQQTQQYQPDLDSCPF